MQEEDTVQNVGKSTASGWKKIWREQSLYIKMGIWDLTPFVELMEYPREPFTFIFAWHK